MAVSSLRLALRLIKVITREAGTAQASAPQNTLPPNKKATDMPVSEEWATASPMKASPFSTTNVPTTAHTMAASPEASKARCMKANPSGSVIKSNMFVCYRPLAISG